MKHVSNIILILGLFVLGSCTSEENGQDRDNVVTAPDEKENRVSPAETASAVIGTNEITISYGSPRVKGRSIWGSLVPYDEVWRTGANEATTVSFSSDVLIDGQLLQADTYSFFTIPGEASWTIIFNLEEKQWGSFKYDSNQDALRMNVTPVQLEEVVENMTFTLLTEENGGTIRLEWEKLRVDIPFVNAPQG
jgi:hypothetical protein